MGLVSLLRRPALAWRLGRRGHRRLARTFDEASCVSGYRDLLDDVAAGRAPRRPEPELVRAAGAPANLHLERAAA
jgi:hypothetical protein